MVVVMKLGLGPGATQLSHDPGMPVPCGKAVTETDGLSPVGLEDRLRLDEDLDLVLVDQLVVLVVVS